MKDKDYIRITNEIKELGSFLEDVVAILARIAATGMTNMAYEEKRKLIKGRNADQLTEIFKGALEKEYYEVCQVIKEELESRKESD